ncbi:hypothetical protein FZC83_02420 [Rossellomorea marisflavi]|uniref:Uncharacterized protein n=2 Tax=Rossellomorea marisflavi TaxID=189381 RepID=A0A5D4S0I7_9BACI|nr:hypothetical protein [Rossellomorea marisflavi]TYS56449.1 hypothetical protein FZC83_02420 [Rossellomorea marisflavi]
MAIVEDQLVEVKWNGNNKARFESLGYKFTKIGDPFLVNYNHLTRYSKLKIKLVCDYCNSLFKRTVTSWNSTKSKSEISGIEHKDACKTCYEKRWRDLNDYDEPEIFDEAEEDLIKVKYTKEKLINYYNKFVQEYGYHPNKNQMDATKGYPSATAFTSKFGTWRKFLVEIGIADSNGNYYEDLTVIEKFYPICKRLSEINSKLISPKSIKEIEKMVIHIGLELRDFYTKRDYSEVMAISKVEAFKAALIDLESDIGKCPTTGEMEKYCSLNKVTARRNIEDYLGMSYAEICMDTIGSENKTTKSKKVLLEELIELKEKLGRVPQSNELKLYGLSEHKAYRRKFNMSYNELIISLGWEQSPYIVETKSKERLLSEFKTLCETLGRVPNHEDLSKCSYTSNTTTYKKHFGSMDKVWDIVGVDFEANQDMSAGIVSKNKNNEVCRSTQELIISNLLIENNLMYVPEQQYSSLLDGSKNRWKMDWYLSDEGIVVEYFGLFDDRKLKINNRVGKYSRKVMKKLKFCKENSIKIIDLYPNDLRDNYKGLKEKFHAHGILIS